MSRSEILSAFSRTLDDGLVVRCAAGQDLPELLALLSQLHDTDTPQLATEHLAVTFDEILRSPTRAILVALREGKLVGTLDLFWMANLTRDGRPWAGIENMIVDAPSRRRGTGRALMAAAVELAREAGCYKLQLVSREERDAAHVMYSSTGFTAPVKGFRRYLD